MAAGCAGHRSARAGWDCPGHGRAGSSVRELHSSTHCAGTKVALSSTAPASRECRPQSRIPNPESRIPNPESRPIKKARRSGPSYRAEPDSERAVQILQLRLARTEVGRQVGDLLVVQVGGLRGHQRVLAGAAAVFLQGVGQVVRVLAAELGVAGVDRGIAFGTVAVDAALAGGLALG